jgi:hypothetical protein
VCSFPVVERRIPPGGSIRGPDTLAEGSISHQEWEVEQGAPFGTVSRPFQEV